MSFPTVTPLQSRRDAPDPSIARQIATCVMGGMTHEQIASFLDMPIDRLRMIYEKALSAGANAIRAAIIAELTQQALKGNVSAAKLLLDRGPLPTGAPPPDGLKAKRNADAVTAADGTDWESLLSAKPAVQ